MEKLIEIFNIFLQEAATSTQSTSSDSNDSCDDEKMILTIAAEDQDINDMSN